MRTSASNSTPVSVRTLTVDGISPSFSAVTPVMVNVSVPDSSSDSAFVFGGNCSGSTPMPIRLERWMRS